MLPQHHSSEDRPAGQGIRARRGPPTGDDTSIRAIAPTSKEGRDAVRSPQAHPAAGSLAAPRPERCARWVPIGGNCAKSAKNGSVIDAERSGSGNCGTYLRHGRAYAPPFASFLIEQIRFRLHGHAALPLQDRVFERNRPVADVGQNEGGASRSLDPTFVGQLHRQLPNLLATPSTSFGAAVQIIWRRCPTRWLLAGTRR